MKKLILIAAVSFLFLNTCVDPYYPKLKSYGSLLVVDGLISNENRSYIVKLSRTIQDQNSLPEAVDDARVSISEGGNVFSLQNCGEGKYKTDSLSFTGMAGRSYTLHIITSDDEEYESDECLMNPVPEIDSVYYARDQELFNNKTEIEDGLRIYIDSKPGVKDLCYRWSFEETWQFKIPYPKKYDYLDSKTIVPVAEIKQYCWKYSKSDDIIIHSAGQNTPIKKQPVNFIASSRTDRLMSEYSILVRQYSVSQYEYDFWKNVQEVGESGDDIFASQPYPVISNIKNINNPGERVLGFFQVSAVAEKRIFIPFSEVVRLHLPFYHPNECARVEVTPAEYSSQYSIMTFDELYNMFCINSDYTFIEPMYDPETGGLAKLVFARPECADCELTGFPEKPDFWIIPD